jgi:hypothetical protein
MHRHEQFMLGGRSRANLRKEGFGIGDMTTETASHFWKIVNHWALALNEKGLPTSPRHDSNKVHSFSFTPYFGVNNVK